MSNMRLSTTFALLREHGACPEGYRKLAEHLGGVKTYGQNKSISLLTVLESNGLNDALWCLRATLPEQAKTRDKLARLFAADCATHVLPIFEQKYPKDKRPRQAIAVARRYARGRATLEELTAASDAARAAARAAAWDAARAAAWDAARAAAWAVAWVAASDAARAAARAVAWDAARVAAWDAARVAEILWQTQRFRRYLERP